MKRLGVITTRWIQTRERNEALDLRVMCLCILEMFRGTLDTIAASDCRPNAEGHSADSIRGTEGHRQ
jgi:phage terminase large subunit GpA-like protein